VTDDDIDAVILEGWPADVRKPRIVVFDYAGNDVPDEHVLHVSSGTPNTGLTGREVFPVSTDPTAATHRPLKSFRCSMHLSRPENLPR
jgi:molybdopterin-guanine dinucleotide biosynthesis protein